MFLSSDFICSPVRAFKWSIWENQGGTCCSKFILWAFSLQNVDRFWFLSFHFSVCGQVWSTGTSINLHLAASWIDAVVKINVLSCGQIKWLSATDMVGGKKEHVSFVLILCAKLTSKCKKVTSLQMFWCLVIISYSLSSSKSFKCSTWFLPKEELCPKVISGLFFLYSTWLRPFTGWLSLNLCCWTNWLSKLLYDQSQICD